MYPDTIILGMGMYEICVAVAMLVGLVLADRMAIHNRFSVPLQRHLILSIVVAVLLGFFGAVLFQATYNFIDVLRGAMDKGASFSEAWKLGVEAFSFKGMTFYGGFVVGAAAFLLYWFFVGKWTKLGKETFAHFNDLSDMAGVILPLVHGIGRLGCFFAGCCHGAETDAWYGVKMDGVKVVPIQLFEAIFLFLLAGGALLAYFKLRKRPYFPALFPCYLIIYGIWRFLIEFARADERGQTIIPFLTPSQLIAVLLIATGVGYLIVYYLLKKRNARQLAAKEYHNKEENENGTDGSIEDV
ncbi:MAG: prolipoprotein diacylglyceryl transferase [Clostridia bacterium]|nr:prolipoprotein diacylglyceryl transferase [Clostridia bacterium]